MKNVIVFVLSWAGIAASAFASSAHPPQDLPVTCVMEEKTTQNSLWVGISYYTLNEGGIIMRRELKSLYGEPAERTVLVKSLSAWAIRLEESGICRKFPRAADGVQLRVFPADF